MFVSSLLSVAFLTSLTTALPTPSPQTDGQSSCDVSQSSFYLVTTSAPLCSSNSSNLPVVSAISLFAPFHQSNIFLRTIGPGYGSLPNFTFSAGALHTYSSDSFGQGNYSYSTPDPVAGGELQLLQDTGSEGSGTLELTAGFLLGMGGVTDQWTLCEGAVGQVVLKWMGGEGCNATYIQAVAAPPY